MVVIQYGDTNYGNSGYGRSAWIRNETADHLIKSLKKPAKRAAGTKPVYVVRCYPKHA